LRQGPSATRKLQASTNPGKVGKNQEGDYKYHSVFSFVLSVHIGCSHSFAIASSSSISTTGKALRVSLSSPECRHLTQAIANFASYVRPSSKVTYIALTYSMPDPFYSGPTLPCSRHGGPRAGRRRSSLSQATELPKPPSSKHFFYNRRKNVGHGIYYSSQGPLPLY